MKQYLTRVFELDVGHRVMHERIKCFSIHGHRIKIELTLLFTSQQDIGYQIDFKEVKRIAGQWLDDKLDHGFIANPCDKVIISACQETGSKYYLMSLNGEGIYCNPTAENISREIFMAMELLFQDNADLTVHHLRFYETPSCWVDTTCDSISHLERANFKTNRAKEIDAFTKHLGIIEYDSRKYDAAVSN